MVAGRTNWQPTERIWHQRSSTRSPDTARSVMEGLLSGLAEQMPGLGGAAGTGAEPGDGTSSPSELRLGAGRGIRQATRQVALRRNSLVMTANRCWTVATVQLLGKLHVAGFSCWPYIDLSGAAVLAFCALVSLRAIWRW
jgi:hypothetical protein